MSEQQQQQQEVQEVVAQEEVAQQQQEQQQCEAEATALSEAGGEHVLESPWTLWFSKKRNKSYEESLEKLITVASIEGFARVYKYLQRPSQLPNNSDYYVFRNETKPMWENWPNGGCWIVKVAKKSPELDRMWEDLLFAAIGELFAEPEVMGVVASVRKKYDTVCVWMNSDVRRVGEKIKSLLGLTGDMIEYKSNKTAMKDGSTYRNALHVAIP
eukprot:m51a1_g7832 hypothetical protein (214) ;mRNA; f:166414-167679